MKPIDGLDRLAGLLRMRIQGTRTDTSTRPAGRQPPQTAPGSRRPVAALEQALRARIRQLRQQAGPQDAVDRAVIGTMLAWELDDRLHNEPKFNALVQQVLRHIHNDPALEQAFRQVLEQIQ